MSVASPAMPARLPLLVVILWTLALTAAILPWLGQMNAGAFLRAFWQVEGGSYQQVLVHYSWAPRFAMAILIGFGLGLAGAVLQQVLGNPLASPTTLGLARAPSSVLRWPLFICPRRWRSAPTWWRWPAVCWRRVLWWR